MIRAFFILILFTSQAFAQVNSIRPDVIETFSGFRNYIQNPSALNNTRFTAVTNATLTRDTDAGDRIDGVASFLCDTTAQNGFCQFNTATIQAPDTVGNCEASIEFKGDASLYSLRLTDGTNTLQDLALGNSGSSWQVATLNYPCGATRDVRLVQTAAGTSPAVNVGRVYHGRARNIGTVAQAEFVGSIRYATTTNCSWQVVSAGSFSNFGADADCPVPTVEGRAQAPATRIPGITFASLPPGRYQFIIQANLANNAGAAGANRYSYYRISDGTNNSESATAFLDLSGLIGTNMPTRSININSTLTNVTFQMQAQTFGGATAQVFAGGDSSEFSIAVYRFPTTSEQAYRPIVFPWKVDANISGANPSLGTTAVTSYTGIENASLTLTNNSGQGNISAQIPCSGTNAPTGSTCSVGNESVGVSFNLPVAGDVLACANFGYSASVNTGSVFPYFQIVETGNANQTIIQEGKSRVVTGINAGAVSLGTPFRVCGNFSFSSAGQKTLRLMYEQAVTGTVTTSAIVADASANDGQRDIHWEVYPITQSVPTPLLVGSITSGSAGLLRDEYVHIGQATYQSNCTTTPCGTFRSSSPWVSSVTRSSTGIYILNIASGTFSSGGVCTCSSVTNGTGANACSVTDFTGSQVTIYSHTGGGTARDGFIDIRCMGPR